MGRTAFLAAWTCFLIVVYILACAEEDKSPSPFSPSLPTAAPVVRESKAVVPGNAGDALLPGCQIISINMAKSVGSIRTVGLQVTMTAFAQDASGSPLYARVWYNERHETKVGDFPVNQEFAFNLPRAGDYTLVVDIEHDADGDGQGDYQCDRIRKHLTVADVVTADGGLPTVTPTPGPTPGPTPLPTPPPPPSN